MIEKRIIFLLLIASFSCVRSEKEGVDLYKSGQECDSLAVSFQKDEKSGVEMLIFNCVQNGLLSKVVINKENRDTISHMKELSDIILLRKYFEDGRQKSEIILVKTNIGEIGNTMKLFDDFGNIRVEKSFFLGIEQIRPNLKFRFFGYEIDSIHMFKDMDCFQESEDWPGRQFAEEISVEDNLFEIDEALFNDMKCVILWVYYCDDIGDIYGKPIRIDGGLVDWLKQNVSG